MATTPAGPVLRKSRVLNLLRSGQSVPCMKLNFADARVVETCGLAGFPVVWLCNEHVPNDWLNMEHQIRAAKLYDMDTIVRVSKGAYSEYVKPFEADATGIMVPHVTTAEEAREIVARTRFYPVGQRAIDGGNSDGKFCRVPVKQYLEHGNTERFIILQIETPEALENVDEIAAVEGFDILHFGPGDFSHRLGLSGQREHPVVVAARQRVAQAAVKHGKYAMAQPVAPLPQLAAEGFKIFSLGADVMGLNTYLDARLAEFNQHFGGAK